MSEAQRRQVRINGQDCSLTRMEYDLYQWMLRHQGAVVSRQALLQNVWGFASEADTRSVDMCVRRLRTKIGTETIHTVYGKGYLMKTT